ncbi:hypothetical protein ACFFLM_21595 [Deinococcus oregonensis]|uniref:Uncharacterized protein n=1 Tax=Deinococcus oregonensis TaxID=1805970 RepID=A0ABV6B6R9_9DEIO
MTDRTYTQAVQPDPVLTHSISRPQQASGQQPFAPFVVQSAATPLPNLTVLAEELRQLHLLCAAQARRLDELEAREHLSWPTRSAYAHLEIDP